MRSLLILRSGRNRKSFKLVLTSSHRLSPITASLLWGGTQAANMGFSLSLASRPQMWGGCVRNWAQQRVIIMTGELSVEWQCQHTSAGC